jgi:hypothetical protein
MIPREDNPAGEAGRLRDRLEAFVLGEEAGASALPWAARLSQDERERLRSELEMILSEPELTGEPVDGQEIDEILPFHPTAGHMLPRGRLEKLKNRDAWQIELPDGYRLRYFIDKLEQTVHIIYLGPPPDCDTSGREQAVRSKMQRGRNGKG